VLPVSGESVEYHVPQAREVIVAGLFPLQLADRVDLSQVEPEGRDRALAEAEDCAKRVIVACCTSPRFVMGRGRGEKFNEVGVDSLTGEDMAHLHLCIMELVEKAYAPVEAARKADPKEAQSRLALAVACRMFGVDPTDAETWPGERAQTLWQYADLVTRSAHGQ
jgi:hypothetical protein